MIKYSILIILLKGLSFIKFSLFHRNFLSKIKITINIYTLDVLPFAITKIIYFLTKSFPKFKIIRIIFKIIFKSYDFHNFDTLLFKSLRNNFLHLIIQYFK